MKTLTAWLTSLFAGDGREVEREEAYRAMEENYSKMLAFRQKREAEEKASRKAVLAKFPPFTIVQTPSGGAYAYVKPDGALSPHDADWLVVHLQSKAAKADYEAYTTLADQWVAVEK